MPDRESALAKYRKGRARTVYDRARAASVQDPRQQEIFNKYIHFRQQCVAKLALKPGETVPDVGCVTGFSFTDLESGVGAHGRIIGIEQSPEQLANARALIEASGWQNITLINSAVEEANIPVSADAALFSFTHDIMRTPRAVENVVNSLKPGGRIVVMGGKWAPWWALATNWRTWRGVRNSSRLSKDSADPGAISNHWFHRLRWSRLFIPCPPVGHVGMYVAVAQK
jgi:precorrin-6B methylase 2